MPVEFAGAGTGPFSSQKRRSTVAGMFSGLVRTSRSRRPAAVLAPTNQATGCAEVQVTASSPRAVPERPELTSSAANPGARAPVPRATWGAPTRLTSRAARPDSASLARAASAPALPRSPRVTEPLRAASAGATTVTALVAASPVSTGAGQANSEVRISSTIGSIDPAPLPPTT